MAENDEIVFAPEDTPAPEAAAVTAAPEGQSYRYFHAVCETYTNFGRSKSGDAALYCEKCRSLPPAHEFKV